MKPKLDLGTSHPLGATLQGGGANFSLFSRSATRVELLFFDRADDAPPVAYATVYPLTMLLRILCAQVLALVLCR